MTALREMDGTELAMWEISFSTRTAIKVESSTQFVSRCKLRTASYF